MRQGRGHMFKALAAMLVFTTTTVACQEKAHPTTSAVIDNQSSVDVGVGWSGVPGDDLRYVAAHTKARVSFQAEEGCTVAKSVGLVGLKRGLGLV
jgi:hypothetical protein